MPNRRQLVPQTAAFLMAFGLIASLLPSFAAAQDFSTVEKHGGWLTEQFCGPPMGGPNAKFGAAAALARLALNPDDAEVIFYITHFYDNVPAILSDASGQCGCWCTNSATSPNVMTLRPRNAFSVFSETAFGFRFIVAPGPFLSRYTGTIRISRPGRYAFFTSSQDCSFLLIDGKEVVAAPGRHGPARRAKIKGEIELSAGLHQFDYWHGASGKETCAVAAWREPGAEKPTPIPPRRFRMEPD